MGEFRNDCARDCCDQSQNCCYSPQNNCCNDTGSSWGILILLIVLYCLFCGNDNRGGGLFGGLF